MEQVYCLKCKSKTETKNIEKVITKNNRNILKGICVICGIKKSKFTSKTECKGLMPEMHLPSHNFTGPFTNLDKRLDKNDNPLPHSMPYNRVDEISRLHYICYLDTAKFKEICDSEMLDRLKTLKTKGVRERLDRRIVKNIIEAKKALGLGNKK